MVRDNGWHSMERQGLRYYHQTYADVSFMKATSGEALIQGVFTREGGASRGPWASLNVGHTVGDDPQAVAANHDRICAALDIPRSALTSAEQVHGVRVGLVGPGDQGCVFAETDALITDVPGVALMLRFADCVPLLFFDPSRPAVGLAHAGWRGSLAGMAGRTVAAMQAAFGSRPEELVVGVGPAIGPCCYEVGWDVARRFQRRYAGWSELVLPTSDGEGRVKPEKPHLSLWQVNRRQLEAAGVRAIAVSEMCTVCHEDQFFSYRAACQDGRSPPGLTGRFAAVIGLRE